MPEALCPFLDTLPSLLEEGAFAPYQKKAWERFLQLGLPTGKEDAFRSVMLRWLYQKEVSTTPAPSFFPQNIGSKALFISLDEAATRFPFVIKDRVEKFIKTEKNPFALLSFALSRGGAFLYVPPGCLLDKPFEVNISSAQFSCPLLLVALGKNASLQMHVTRESSNLSFGLTDLFLDSGSTCHLTEVQIGDQDEISFQALRGELKQDSHLKTIHFSKGSKIDFHHKRVTLAGGGAEADLAGLWSLKEARSSEIWIEMVHQEPNARSRQRFKGALFDQSSSCFHGEIYVDAKAQGTDAYQMNQNLLLSDEAKAEARPNLQIFADDVKASHGSTAGGLQPEEIFYLKTRGIPEKRAKDLLIHAFLEDIISLHPESARRKELAQWIEK